MDISVKPLNVTDSLMSRYNSQQNVTRQSGICNLNYGKIVLLQDMDPDGNSIACLMIKFFSKWPDLFKNNVVRRAITPLFIANKKGKEAKYFYTFEEYEKNKSSLSGWDIDYIKGLGTLEKADYKNTIILDPRQLIIELDSIDKLEMAFGDSADARKDWMID